MTTRVQAQGLPTRALLIAAAVLLGAATALPRPAVPIPAVQAAVVDPALETAVAAGHADAVVQVLPEARDAALAAVDATGGTVTLDLPLIDGFAATLTADGVAALRDLPGVRALTHDGPVRPSHDVSGQPVDAPGVVNWLYEHEIGAATLHEQGVTGDGVGIAFIDTGVAEVTELDGRVVEGIDISGEDVDEDTPPNGEDRYGHGTFVAGVAAATSFGVAPEATVVPIKVAGADGAADVTHIIAGLQFVHDVNAMHREKGLDPLVDVVNLSLGTDSNQSWKIDPLNAAVERVWDSGVVVVVSVGNLGPKQATVSKPADDPLVISVGAADGNGTLEIGDDTVADYSSRGPTRSGNIRKPDIVAPGSHILGLRVPGSTIDEDHPEGRVSDDLFRGSGTSFAAAQVAGSAALLLDAHPGWTPDEVKGALTSTAVVPAAMENKWQLSGSGLVQVSAAHALDDPPTANIGVERGDGSGSLAESRGSHPEPDASSDGSNWYGSNWYGSNWYGSNWYGSNWYGSNWYGSNWYGSNWYGSNWYGIAWNSVNWY